jgi:hypothetical protein
MYCIKNKVAEQRRRLHDIENNNPSAAAMNPAANKCT